jgi:hypothetical protein
VPSSEALLQLAIFDLILLLDECYSFQIMTEGRQTAYQLSQGVPVACHKHLWRLFHMADAFLKRQTSASGIKISLSHFVKKKKSTVENEKLLDR